MTTESTVAVTYVGKENPFKDRLYRSGLTFTPGQTRPLPPALAARFLHHDDLFKPTAATKAAESAKDKKADADADTSGKLPVTTGALNQPVDDTAKLLAEQSQQQSEQRAKEDARYALLEQLEKMDRPGLINWAQDTYKQKIPGNLGVAKARDMAKGFVDQYGMP